MLLADLSNIIQRAQWEIYDLVAAAVILGFGWYFANVAGREVAGFIERAALSRRFKKLGWENHLSRLWPNFTVPALFGRMAAGWVLLFFLMVCAVIVGLDRVSPVLYEAVWYCVNIAIAISIFIIAALAVDGGRQWTAQIMEKKKAAYPKLLGNTVGGAIWVLSAIAIARVLRIISGSAADMFYMIAFCLIFIAVAALTFGAKTRLANKLEKIEKRLK